MFKSIEIASFRRINLFRLRSTETPSRSVEPERRSLRFHLIAFKQKIGGKTRAPQSREARRLI